MTTLRGGTLGYAEIVALKVNRPPPPRKSRHACGAAIRTDVPNPPSPAVSRRPITSTIIATFIAYHHHYRHHRRRFFCSSFHPRPPLPTSLSYYHLSVRSVPARGNPRVVAYIPLRQAGSLSPRSLASRCLVRCFRCNVLSLVYAVEARRRRPIVESALSSYFSSS